MTVNFQKLRTYKYIQVIGACGGPEKCELVKQRGAIECIDYNKESIRERMKEITDGNGADIIFEVCGGKIFDESLRRLIIISINLNKYI